MKKIVSWSAVIGCGILIFILSDQPASVSKELSGGVKYMAEKALNIILGNRAEPVTISHTTLRKLAHYFIYFMLGFLLMNVLSKPGKNLYRFFIVVLISALFACSDEVHQQFILGRSGELRDVFIDTCGAATGALLLIMIRKMIGVRKQQRTL